MDNSTSDVWIYDDGTLDTVVVVNGNHQRFDSEYRFSFTSDEEFLAQVIEEYESGSYENYIALNRF